MTTLKRYRSAVTATLVVVVVDLIAVAISVLAWLVAIDAYRDHSEDQLLFVTLVFGGACFVTYWLGSFALGGVMYAVEKWCETTEVER